MACCKKRKKETMYFFIVFKIFPFRPKNKKLNVANNMKLLQSNFLKQIDIVFLYAKDHPPIFVDVQEVAKYTKKDKPKKLWGLLGKEKKGEKARWIVRVKTQNLAYPLFFNGFSLCRIARAANLHKIQFNVKQ
jgi:hypothetical protein